MNVRRQRIRTATPGRALSDLYPLIAAQAFGWDPRVVPAKSNIKRPWKCRRGHIWESAVNNRVAGNGCPYCSGRRIIVGETDLLSVDPEIAAQAFGWDPTTVSAKSKAVKSWRCMEGHDFRAAVSRRITTRSCPVCDRRRLIKGVSDLATTDPEIARQAHGWDPTTVKRGSGFVGAWRCDQGHVWRTSVNARTLKGRGCGVCANQIVLPGFNDLATVNPSLAAEAHGWDPTTETSGSRHKRGWKCPEGHCFEASISSRKRGNGCPVCSGKSVLPGFNDLATVNPSLAAEAHGWDPTTVTAHSKKRRSWKCELGHVWQADVGSRHRNGCPVCSGRTVLPGFNDLATVNPSLAAEAHGWDPTTRTKYSPKKVGWKCPLGHLYSAAVNNRSGGKGCPICSGHVVLVGFNDFASQFPQLAHQADGWDPTSVTKASGIRKQWICDLGHRWRAPVSERARGQGCPSCAKSGFDPNLDGYLYFLSHDIWSMYQIGITNQPAKRLKDHQRLGWQAIEIRGPMDGHHTSDLETAMLRSLKRRGAMFANKSDVRKFDGWSEAWLMSSLACDGIKQLLSWVHEDETITHVSD